MILETRDIGVGKGENGVGDLVVSSGCDEMSSQARLITCWRFVLNESR